MNSSKIIYDTSNVFSNLPRKVKSFGNEDSLILYNKNLELEIQKLRKEINDLKRRLEIFEEETNRNRWGIRYSRRMAVMSNLFLGLWIFWGRFLKHVQKQKKSRLLGVVLAPPPLKQQQFSLNKILYEAYMKAISKSWIFFIGSYLITRNSWKRHIGIGLTTVYSLYLAIFSHFLPWTNYFNMFSNLLYITTTWTYNINNEIHTINDIINEDESDKNSDDV